jgi:hydrogenase expression/formation protein HypD
MKQTAESLPWSAALRDRRLAAPLLRRIESTTQAIGREVAIMEVCGTHTVALRRSGVHTLLPDSVRLLSGPGCPVCVTPTGYIDNALRLLEDPAVTLASFGDMLKVPGSDGASLASRLGSGRVRLLYSPAELPELARRSPGPLVFLAVGFETTAPTVAAATLAAVRAQVHNLFLYTAFKTVPPALRALLASRNGARAAVAGGPGPGGTAAGLDAFLLPGHVSVIIGEEPYGFLEEQGGLPGVITGFEPLDLLSGILACLEQIARGERRVENGYTRAVRREGNPKARAVMEELLEPEDALWRGLGRIPGSGLRLRPGYAALDAARRFSLPEPANVEPPGCGCAQVLQGRMLPRDCPLFARRCTPETPVGPCMVSSEGSCAASFRYGGEKL